MTPRLDRVLVTGATRGIGRAVVELLLAEGRKTHAVGRDWAALARLATEHPGAVTTSTADLSRPADVARLLPEAIAALGGVDAVVSCAGIAPHRPVEGIDAANIDAQVAVNLRAPLLLARDLITHLRSRHAPGAFVAVGSTLAVSPASGTAVYAATKAGLAAAMRTLALEVASEGIRINTVAPGIIDTEMVRELRQAPGESAPSPTEARERVAAQLAGFAALHPLGRLGRVDEVAAAVRFLLDAEFAVGTVLVLDGGLTLR